ncbi:hypothetical protein [Litchfieldia alkalitelluris]|nr:hypothetical protein [Litchfieldia alkalitelluris]
MDIKVNTTSKVISEWNGIYTLVYFINGKLTGIMAFEVQDKTQ